MFKGTLISDWLLNHKETSLSAKVVYGALCRFIGKDGKRYPKVKQISEKDQSF